MTDSELVDKMVPVLGMMWTRARSTMANKTRSPVKNTGLVCSECGNKQRFIEIMAQEAHLVDGARTYIRLLEARADRYLCWECGATIE